MHVSVRHSGIGQNPQDMKAGGDTPYLRKQLNFNENDLEMKTLIILTHHELTKKKVVYVRVKMDVV